VRIIAGTAKGRTLARVPPGVRPLSDRAREGLFASLGDEVAEANCLDLFAGTGAVGIEALSRGASSCTFVDRSRAAVAAIKGNLARVGLERSAVVRCSDVLSWLRKGSQGQPPASFVFMDPPYDLGSPYVDDCLSAMGPLLDLDGWTVVVTRGHKSPLPAVPLHWAVARQLRYGDSLLTLYREERWA
jgi:16S rRNA (guanine966-N2)-methyltransferase